jgi:hypothetical protein
VTTDNETVTVPKHDTHYDMKQLYKQIKGMPIKNTCDQKDIHSTEISKDHPQDTCRPQEDHRP